jgi:hypothetical protein
VKGPTCGADCSERPAIVFVDGVVVVGGRGRNQSFYDAGQSRSATALVTRAAWSGDVKIQRRHCTTLASGFALEYSKHALDANLEQQ